VRPLGQRCVIVPLAGGLFVILNGGVEGGTGRSVKTFCISNPELGHFLRREQQAEASYETDLNAVFCDILNRANEFLPSEAGSIFIDDPILDARDKKADLVVIACFGETGDRLVGSRMPATRGIVGHVYATGRAYISADPAEDPLFFRGLDGASRFKARSLVCAPLMFERRMIGAIELLNRMGASSYDQRDQRLLEIFALTISGSLANAIDAYRSKEMAKRDELTGLYNDRYLHHSLGQVVGEALVDSVDCGLIFLDLDRFKEVNDIHGHLAGSRVLSEVGAMLRQILPGGCIPARYGGDEFIIVLPSAGQQELYWVAETVRKNIESYVFLERADPHDPLNYPALNIANVITCSVGLATLRGDVLPGLGSKATDAIAVKNELIRLADECMYVAKESGRNRTVVASQRRGGINPFAGRGG
jgi:diguanylate cyclase (GGDEF)-like protein